MAHQFTEFLEMKKFKAVGSNDGSTVGFIVCPLLIFVFPFSRFDECDISPWSIKALSSAGYVRMTKVQEATLSLDGSSYLILYINHYVAFFRAKSTL